MRMEPPHLYLPAEALEDVRRLLLIMQRLDRGRMVCELHGVKPGATAILDGEPLRLFGPRVLPPLAGIGRPGEVMGLEDGRLTVACGDAQGARIGFAELQLPGRRRLPAPAVLAGRPIPVGTRFGAP